ADSRKERGGGNGACACTRPAPSTCRRIRYMSDADGKPEPSSAPDANGPAEHDADLSDLHAALASMPAVEALNFVIDYLGSDFSTDTAGLDTPNTLPDDDFA